MTVNSVFVFTGYQGTTNNEYHNKRSVMAHSKNVVSLVRSTEDIAVRQALLASTSLTHSLTHSQSVTHAHSVCKGSE